ncbi:MAG: twin-arginine translocase subunit TatC, partial [Anaerolineae bacterium]|nr:twin-arginine translocase subunit TatC [Anaerolineae bacterium]
MSRENNDVENSGMMTLLEHLVELKDHLVRIAIALVICGAASFFFADEVFGWIMHPLDSAVEEYKVEHGGAAEIIATEPTTMIGLFMKISLFSGAIIAMPFILYQVLHYILPGLTRKEQLALFVIIPGATFFFVGGVAFAYFVMVPAAIPFLLGFGWMFLGGDVVVPKWQVDKYLPFLLNLVFWVGVAFETPLIMAFVARLGVVT